MFRVSSTNNQADMFCNSSSIIPESLKKIYEDTNGWHNLFYKQITCHIDENIFKPLFNKRHGSPNFPIRVLVAMFILKEGDGMSDSTLYEDVRFNLLIRRCLGLVNLSDDVPVSSTYYLFRKRLADYQNETGIDLMKLMFQNLTQEQCKEFNVKGKRIRMDSKLLGSNIAWLSRYELVHNFLANFYKTAKRWDCLKDTEIKMFEDLKNIKGGKVVYNNPSAYVIERLTELGTFISGVLESCLSQSNTKIYQSLKRLFSEQYEVLETEKIVLREHKKIAADSIQSPHDTDATYRNKGEQKVKGYSINVCETNDDDASLNLITDVQVAKATTSDNQYLISAIVETEKITKQFAKDVHVDGCYHDEANKTYCEENEKTLHLTGLQGAEGRYALEVILDNELKVTDTKTGEIIPTIKISSRNGETKWKMKLENKNYRYFTQKEVDSYAQRQQITNTPKKILQKRNNVEATIFQMGFHYARGKTKYRGIERQNIWVKARCLWVNFVRITKYINKKTKDLIENNNNLKNNQVAYCFLTNFNTLSSIILAKLGIFKKNSKFSNFKFNFFENR